jgi:hypothetical protein
MGVAEDALAIAEVRRRWFLAPTSVSSSHPEQEQTPSLPGARQSERDAQVCATVTYIAVSLCDEDCSC